MAERLKWIVEVNRGTHWERALDARTRAGARWLRTLLQPTAKDYKFRVVRRG